MSKTEFLPLNTKVQTVKQCEYRENFNICVSAHESEKEMSPCQDNSVEDVRPGGEESQRCKGRGGKR